MLNISVQSLRIKLRVVQLQKLVEINFHFPTLKIHVTEVLKSLENDIQLLETLLLSYPERLDSVRRANSGHN